MIINHAIVIKIRRRGTTLYSEIELEELNYRHLLDKISFKFDIPIDCIQYITKDEDVDISDDSDVVRLLNNQRLEFIVNVNMLSKIIIMMIIYIEEIAMSQLNMRMLIMTDKL